MLWIKELGRRFVMMLRRGKLDRELEEEMPKNSDKSNENRPAEFQLAGAFPDLYPFYSRHPGSRPQRSESWEQALLVARNPQPILADLRSRGLNLVHLNQYTPPGTDLRPLYETVLEWLHRIQDPLTLT